MAERRAASRLALRCPVHLVEVLAIEVLACEALHHTHAGDILIEAGVDA